MSQIRLIFLFVLAVFALVITGYLLNPDTSTFELLLLLLLCGGGTAIVYGYDFAQLKRSGYNDLISNVLNSPVETLFYFIFVVFIAPLSFFYLSSFRVNLLLVICLLGLLYSMPFNYQGKRMKLKHLVFVKNTFIGFSWGALILVGAGAMDAIEIIAFFLFVSFQVVVGSMIRDLSDVEKDAKDHVATLPVKFGIPKTIQILHFLNIISLIPLAFVAFSQGILLMLPVFTWRVLVIWRVSKDHCAIHWTQTCNILTCVIIGVAMAMFKLNL